MSVASANQPFAYRFPQTSTLLHELQLAKLKFNEANAKNPSKVTLESLTAFAALLVDRLGKLGSSKLPEYSIAFYYAKVIDINSFNNEKVWIIKALTTSIFKDKIASKADQKTLGQVDVTLLPKHAFLFFPSVSNMMSNLYSKREYIDDESETDTFNKFSVLFADQQLMNYPEIVERLVQHTNSNENPKLIVKVACWIHSIAQKLLNPPAPQKVAEKPRIEMPTEAQYKQNVANSVKQLRDLTTSLATFNEKMAHIGITASLD